MSTSARSISSASDIGDVRSDRWTRATIVSTHSASSLRVREAGTSTTIFSPSRYAETVRRRRLLRRAHDLNDRYLGGLATPESVRWVENQNSRWGSCTPGDRTIRLSVRLQGMPGWVTDYVLVHELAHLIEPGHDPAFWGWVDRYPQAERAKGFLIGWSTAARLDPPPSDHLEPDVD